MRKLILVLMITVLLALPGCRAVYGAIWTIPEWIGDKVLNVYTGNGHYDGKQRWNNFMRNYQQIWNVIDIYLFNYDVTDPSLGSPFFGDPP